MMTGSPIGRWFLGILILALPGALLAASPPGLVNYQGVLRSAADEPLTGAYDMTFRFFDAEFAGDELLVDQHLASNTQAVAVDGGLFSVELGGGAVADGSGPGTYGSLAGVFHDYDEVWLEVEIDGETLAPRTRVLASAYAFNAGSAGDADQLNGQSSSFYLDTSSTPQVKAGTIQFHAAQPGQPAVDVIGDSGSLGALHALNNYGAYCNVAYGNDGIECRGSSYGGFFYDLNDASYAYLGYATFGAYAAGQNYGGAFTATGGTGIGVYSVGPYNAGYFRNTANNAEVRLGAGTYAVDAHGTAAAQFLQDGLPGTYLWIGYSGYGILGKNYNGIHEIDIADSSWSRIGNSPYKIQGTGSVSFVQNHPDDPNEVVIYHAPESSEVNVYTRGSARLIDGFAHVDLDPTFAWTANPDIGLTAHLTPRDEPVALAVEQVSSTELVVRGPKGSNVAFDYWVTGLRIGFEEMPAVSQKEDESWIPLRASGDDVYAKAPGLRAYNALERYRSMARALGRPVDPGLRATADLKSRIGLGRPSISATERSLPSAITTQAPPRPVPEPAGPEAGDAGSPGRLPDPATNGPSGETSEVKAWRRSGEMFIATSQLQAGDVVVLDPTVAGGVKRCDKAADRNLVGVAVTSDHDGMVEVAVAEIREVLVDASVASIAAGDFLTTSTTEGAAMRATTDSPGTILGKALEPLGSGIGTIRVLLMPR